VFLRFYIELITSDFNVAYPIALAIFELKSVIGFPIRCKGGTKMLNHQGTKILETNRIILRPFQETDAKDMYQNWASDDEVTRFLTWPSHKDRKVSENITKLWITEYGKRENYQWAIEFKKIGQVIGSVSLMNIDNENESCEVGYCIGKTWWNQGIMTEVLTEIIRFACLEVGFERFVARHDILNPASGCVMLKCGLHYEGTLRKVLRNNKGTLVDCKYYSILKEEVK
jgi:ribosomal-protein-alanine N-acetyltransferase